MLEPNYTRCITPEATTLWFVTADNDGTEPATNAGKLEDDYDYDVISSNRWKCSMLRNKWLQWLKQLRRIGIFILWDGGTIKTTYSDSGTARCIIDFTNSEVATITQILAGQGRDERQKLRRYCGNWWC